MKKDAADVSKFAIRRRHSFHRPQKVVSVLRVPIATSHATLQGKSEVFTWGNGDILQLGMGRPGQNPLVGMSSFTIAKDPKTGGNFYFISKPAVVQSLVGKRVTPTFAQRSATSAKTI